MILVSLISLVSCIFCIFYAKKFNIGLDSISNYKPQKFHHFNVSRLGGVGIFIGFIFGVFYLFSFSWENLLIFFGLSVVFLAGILEDILEVIKPHTRLLIQICGIILMLFYTQGLIQDLSPLVFLPWYLGFIFSLFGIVGVCNAFNIIDGLNGLSSGIALIVLGAIVFVAQDSSFFIDKKEVFFLFSKEKISNNLIFVSNIGLIAWCSIMGFFILNFPFGKIFLGDGGAYFLGALIGFLLGILSNNGISAWFGLCVMIYPVWEVVFSIIRRKITKRKAMQPDGLHLHSLIFKLVLNNALSTTMILCIYGVYITFVLLYANSAHDFMLWSLCFCIFYTGIYFILFRQLKLKESNKL